jgi:hypothetical protein
VIAPKIMTAGAIVSICGYRVAAASLDDVVMMMMPLKIWLTQLLTT